MNKVKMKNLFCVKYWSILRFFKINVYVKEKGLRSRKVRKFIECTNMMKQI
jgi:hypothetical protein